MASLRQIAGRKLRHWSARRHGRDALPVTIHRRRVYILPSRFGLMLALILAAMLIAGLNYNSNLGLVFAFLVGNVALVTMHHCNRNLLRLRVNAVAEVDAFAGREALLEFELRNDSGVDRCDIQICCTTAVGMGSVAANQSTKIRVAMPVARRGVQRVDQFELKTFYPFGWFYSWTYVQSPLTLFIAPNPAGTRALPSVARGGATHSETHGDEDFTGLRAYQPGIPLKHMAWKVLARGGEAAVRTYSSLAAQPEWLEWSSLAGLDTESRLSQLCLWILDSDAAQRLYWMRIPGKEFPPSGGPAHRLACLRALAAYGSNLDAR